MEKLPNRIRFMRKQAGLTIDELAARVGMKPPHLSMMERGKRPLMLDRMRLIAEQLNCSVADLLADEDNPDRLPEPIAQIVERLTRMDAANLEKLRDITAIFAPEPASVPVKKAANGNG